MKTVYRLITFIVFITVSINEFFLGGGLLLQLDILLRMFTRYNHHQKNYGVCWKEY